MLNRVEKIKKSARLITEYQRLRGHKKWVHSIAFSPDCRLLASGSVDAAILLWEVKSGRKLKVLKEHRSWVYCLAFSPDGRILASGSEDKTIRLWAVNTGRELQVLKGHRATVESIAFSQNGRVLASCSKDKTIRLWDVEICRAIKVLEGHNDSVCCVNISPDCRLLASGSEDETIRLWEVETGRELQVLAGHRASVRSVAFSPDGRLLASGSSDNTIRLWEIESGRQLQVLKGQSNSVVSVAISSDGRILASGSFDKTIRLWKIDTDWEFRVIEEIGSTFINNIVFSPGGRFVVYGGGRDYTLHLWDISALNELPWLKLKSTFRKYRVNIPEINIPMFAHLNSLPFAHTNAVIASRPVYWLQHAAAIGGYPPLCIVQDLGNLLTQSCDRLEISRPAYLQENIDTSGYFDFLKKLANHPLLCKISSLNLADTIVGVLLARLVSGIEFPPEYTLPSAEQAVIFSRILVDALNQYDPAQIRQDANLAEQPGPAKLLPSRAMVQIESNLQRLDMDELRFLRWYGPRFAGSPDPRELLDLFNLLDLPRHKRLVLSQVLRLDPSVSQQVSSTSAQTYAMDGYASFTRKGSLDSLLPTELAYAEEIFYHRVLNLEALYYGRESEHQHQRELAYIVTQVGLEILGDVDVLARALTLALAKTLQCRGFDVKYSFVGSRFTKPAELSRPSEMFRLLYYRDKGWLHGEDMLQSVLSQLRGWDEQYRSKQVYWVIGEYWDADDYLVHQELYDRLQQKAGLQAWFICVGNNSAAPNGRLPVTANLFKRYHIVNNNILWQQEGGVEEKF